MPKMPNRPCLNPDCECVKASFPELLFRSATFWYSMIVFLFSCIMDAINVWESHECYIWPSCPGWLVLAEGPLTSILSDLADHVIWQERYGTDANGEPLYWPLGTSDHLGRSESLKELMAEHTN